MTQPSTLARALVCLIANDQEWSARSLDSILSPRGYTIIRAYTGAQALDRARMARPDLVILDAQLPDIHGLEVCRQLRADPRFGRVMPIIITTAGPSGRSQRLAAYEAGAWEFYGQPLDGEALLARVDTFIAAKLEADALREAALIDPESGLYTLRGLSVRVRELGADALRNNRAIACIALSLSPGPGASDSASPPTLGQLLRRQGRTSDAIARLGGDEYLLVAPNTESRGCVRLVERLAATLEHQGDKQGLLAGYSTVSGRAEMALEPAALLDQATRALRYRMAHPGDVAALSFVDVPVPTES